MCNLIIIFHINKYDDILWIDIAEATKKGDIGEKLRQALTAQNAAQIDSETKIITTQRLGEGGKEEIKVKMALKVFENQYKGDMLESNKDLATKKATRRHNWQTLRLKMPLI